MSDLLARLLARLLNLPLDPAAQRAMGDAWLADHLAWADRTLTTP